MPTLVASYYLQQGNNANTMTTPTFTPTAGEVIVVKAQGSHGDGTNFSGPTDSSSVIFFAQRQLDDAISRDRIGLWTAVVSAAAAGFSNSISLTAPAAGTGSNARSMVVERWSGAALAGSPATALGSAAGSAPSTALTTVGVNSIVSWVNTDWNAVDGASRTYRTTSAVPVEENYDFITGDHTGEFAYQLAAAPGSQTLGLTAPAAENWSLASVEILDAPVAGGQPTRFAPGQGPMAWTRFIRPQGIVITTGQTFAVSLAGSTSPAGEITKQANLAKASTTTPVGALTKLITKPLAGVLSPTGALTLAKIRLLALAGSISPTGALTKLVTKPLAGLTTPAGSIVKLVLKALSGALSPTGSLALAKLRIMALAGSVSPTGALAKLVAKPLAGSTTPAGAFTKLVKKALAGSITPTGALTLVKVFVLALSGSITPTGVLTRKTLKSLVASLAPAGSLAKLVAKKAAGALTPSGVLTKTRLVAIALAGSLTPVGALTKRTTKALGGALTPTGQLILPIVEIFKGFGSSFVQIFQAAVSKVGGAFGRTSESQGPSSSSSIGGASSSSRVEPDRSKGSEK